MDKKKKKKSGVLSLIIILICVAVGAFSAFKLIGIFLEYKAGTDEYKGLKQYTQESADASGKSQPVSAGTKTAEPVPPLKIDFKELRAINPDVVGWLYIGSLKISYPIVQGPDNDYYLHRTFRKQKNFSGSIFIEAKNSRNFTDPNTIVYGHNMKNGSMFGTLKHLTTEEKYKDNPYFWILTPNGNFCYQMFSLHKTAVDSEVYTLFSGEDQQVADYAEAMRRSSEVNLKAPAFTAQSKIATLSTCTSDSSERYVVQGVMIKKTN